MIVRFKDGRAFTVIHKPGRRGANRVPIADVSAGPKDKYGRVIRIDREVWDWLVNQAEPLTDTPNSVLRRVAGLPPKPRRVWKKEEK